MFLSAQEIAASREQALGNLLALSSHYLATSQRACQIATGAGREGIEHVSRRWSQLAHGQLDALIQFPATLWLDALPRAGELLDQSLQLLGEAHKAWLQGSEAQVRIVDGIVFAYLRRAGRSSPWEAVIVLDALRSTLNGAEQTLHEINTAAIEQVDRVGEEMQQVVTPSANRRVRARSKPEA